MATLVGSDIRETPRVIGLILMTIAVMAGTSFATDFLGLWWVWHFIDRLPFWTGLAASLALWGGVMLLCLQGPRLVHSLALLLWQRGPAAVIAIVRAGGFASTAVGRALRTLCGGAVLRLMPLFTAIAVALEPFRMGLMLMAEPLLVALAPVLGPLRNQLRSAVSPLIALARWACFSALPGLWRRAVSPVIARAVRLAQALQFEWMLWRTYRAEFRGAFASYREFKREFNARMNASSSGSERNDPPAPAPDPFAAACKVMGLPAGGKFTEAEFKTRYRALMKEVHPDIAGPNERAAQVNAASMEIKKRKGWS
jgi:hypothetical protein